MEQRISELLSNFIPHKNVKYIVNSKNIKYWKRAFTHDSVNYKKNYEKYEFLGDSIVGYAFNKFLYYEKGIKTAALLNNLLNFYMSKDYQPKIAEKINIVDLGIYNPSIKIDASVYEDIFEAFFGVFGNICRKLNKSNPEKFKDPIDYTVDFFKWYFDKHEKLNITSGIPIKGIFLNFYDFFSGVSPLKTRDVYFNKKTKKFIFNPKYLEGIKNYSNELSVEISKVIKKSRETELEYIKEVMDIFYEYGYDSEWFANEKDKLSFDFNIKEIANKHGYLRFILERNNKNSYNLISQKVHPITRNSISTIIKEYDNIPFNELKKDAINVIYDNFS